MLSAEPLRDSFGGKDPREVVRVRVQALSELYDFFGLDLEPSVGDKPWHHLLWGDAALAQDENHTPIRAVKRLWVVFVR